MKVNFTIETDGKGLWTDYAGPVTVIELSLNYISDDLDHGELMAKLQGWNHEERGIVYTDPLWIKQFKKKLCELGGNNDVGYSEAGMQGDDYVDLDVGKKFLMSKLGVSLTQDSRLYPSGCDDNKPPTENYDDA